MNAGLTYRSFSKLQPAAMNLASPPIQAKAHATTAAILVVDADRSNANLLSDFIEDAGFNVVVAHDGREAHRILQSSSNFIAAIFEVVIPHVSGPDLVRYMKRVKHLREIPVIMMTREGSARLGSESFSAGAAVLLPEPFSISQVQNLLHMLVNSYSAGNKRNFAVLSDTDPRPTS